MSIQFADDTKPYTSSRHIQIIRQKGTTKAFYMLTFLVSSAIVNPFVCLSVCSSVFHTILCQKDSSYNHAVVTAEQLHHSTFFVVNVVRTSKSNTGKGDAEWDRGRKICNYEPISGRISETMPDGTKVAMNEGPRICLSIGTEIIDLGSPWTDDAHSIAEAMRIFEPTAQICIKLDP